MIARPRRCGNFKRASQLIRSSVRVALWPAPFTGICLPPSNAEKSSSRDRFLTLEQEKEIAAAFRQISDGKLVDVSALLDNKYDIGLLRIFRAFAARGIENPLIAGRAGSLTSVSGARN